MGAPILQSHSMEEGGDGEEEDNYGTELADGSPSTPITCALQREEDEEAYQQEEEAHAEEDGDEFNPYQFIAHLPAHATVCIVDKICLPQLALNGSKKQELPTLALDLDETLVHCTVEPIAKPDLVFPVK